MAPKDIGLAEDNNLVVLEDGLIQARELKVISSKKEKKVEEEEKSSAAKRQRYNTITEIIN